MKRIVLLTTVAFALGCGGGDDEATATATSSTSSGSVSSASSGTGGAGGAGSSSSGTGGTGGAPVTCVDAAAYGALFTIADPSFCAVAVYDADVAVGYTNVPTWGRHGGPTTVVQKADGSIDVVRWTPPAAASGAMTSATTNVAAAVPMDAFIAPSAVDLPFFGWTLLGWSGAFPNTQGEAILANDTAIDATYAVNGFFAATAVGNGGGGRVLYTGLSALEDAATSVNGVYCGDSCGKPNQMPRLVPAGDASCAAPAAVATWGDFSGPIASDAAGDVFVVMPKFDGTQEARGFAADSVKRGAPPAAGDPLFTMPGGGSGLAAFAGMLAFQPDDATTFAPLDVVEVPIAIANGTVTAQPQKPLLTLTSMGTWLSLFRDNQDRLWVAGMPDPNGTKSTFVVLAPAP